MSAYASTRGGLDVEKPYGQNSIPNFATGVQVGDWMIGLD